jgi:hypothetical protein
VPADHQPVDSGLLSQSGRELPSAPVETKGYINIIKLPEWHAAPGIAVNSKKPFSGRRQFILERYTSPDACRFGAFAIRFKTVQPGPAATPGTVTAGA